MPTWPTTLSQDLIDAELSLAAPNTVIRTETDAGPVKVRRRFTAAPKPLSGRLVLTSAQRTLLERFFEDDLQGGAVPFAWHSLGGFGSFDLVDNVDLLLNVDELTTLVSVRLSTLRFQPVGNALWDANLELEILP